MDTENRRPHEDDLLDETLEETFPASDAPANTVETGIVARDLPSPLPGAPSDNPARSRFEIAVEGGTAFLSYRRGVGSLTLVHTEVPDHLQGHGLGTALVEAALAHGRLEGLRIVAECPFVRAFLRKGSASRPGAQ